MRSAPPAPEARCSSSRRSAPACVGHDSFSLDDAALVGWADAVHVGPEAYERYRIAHGVPAMGAELTDDTIPAEAGQWLIDASVSFTKGCYTGQELVARIDSRGGNVPRPVRLLVVDGEFPVAPGAEIRADGQPVGTVTSATPPLSPGHPGLAAGPARPVGRRGRHRRGRDARGLDAGRCHRAAVRGPCPGLSPPTTT